MIIGTAGHIDHGKTALVRALTGVDTDRLPEEKRRGITIELGFAPLPLEGVGTVGVVDVPGHEGFVRTMVAGATGIDLALLVIAADEGVMPQTREHLSILALLDVRSLVVALTKADLPDPDWMTLVRDDIDGLLRGGRYEGSPVIPTSVRDGRGLDELKATLATALQEGSERPDDDLFRMPIDRAFTVKGTGTVVTGTVWSGRLQEGDTVRVYPADRQVRVRGIQSHGALVGTARPGQRAAVALVSVDVEDVPRGSQLVSPAPWQPTTLFHAHVVRNADASPWKPREWLRLHVGTSEVGARVVAPATDLGDGTAGLARVVLDTPLLLRAGDRFVLRRAQPLSTVGGGTVTDPTPLRRRSRPTITVGLSPVERLRLFVSESGSDGMAVTDLPIRLGIGPSAVSQVLQREASVVRVGDRLYLKRILDDSSEAVVNAVITHHHEHPLSPGLAVGSAFRDVATERFRSAVVDRLVAAGTIELVDGLLRKPGWTPKASGRDETSLRWLQDRLQDAGREPPSVGELRDELAGQDPIPFLRILERNGVVVQVEPDRFYATDAVAGMMQELRDGMQGGGEYAPAQLREMLGISRKFLMPFLEFCDRRHLTERRPNGRVLARRQAG